MIVNTALIGNYTPGAKVAVNGILKPGEYMGKAVNLLPYFNGGYVSSNPGLKGVPASVNFLDDGGATPLFNNMPAAGTNSAQYRLLTHLYQYVGVLAGCSMVGQDGFASYQGTTKMYELHKFMNINEAEIGYFNQQVGLALSSFGAADEDVNAVGTALNNLFGYRCSNATSIPPNTPPQLQAMCIASDCPEATVAPVCGSYNKARNGVGVDPATAATTPGPQASALLGQLSSISTAVASGSALSYTTSTFVTSVSGTAETSVTVVPIAGGVHLTTGTVTVISLSSTSLSTFTSTVTGLGGEGGIIETTGTTTGTGSSSFTSTYTSTGSVSQVVTSVLETMTSGGSTMTTSVATTENTLIPITVESSTSLITTGGSTITSVVVSTGLVSAGGAGSAASTTKSKAAGVPLKVQGGVLAVAGMAAAVML